MTSSFSECAVTSEASIRITMVLPKSVSATREGGIRPCRWAISDHTCARVFARVRAILCRWVCPLSFSARHSVGSEGSSGPSGQR